MDKDMSRFAYQTTKPVNDDGFIFEIEVVDLSDSNAICKRWTDIPTGWGHSTAFGGLVDDGLMICDGETLDTNILFVTQISATPLDVKLPVGLVDASSTVLDDKKSLFITGGNSKITFLLSIDPIFLTFFPL